VALEDHRHVTPLRRQRPRRGRYELVAHPDLAGRRLDEARDQPQRRRLAAAGRSEQADQPAMLDGERHVVDDRNLSIALGQPSQFNRRHARPPRRPAGCPAVVFDHSNTKPSIGIRDSLPPLRGSCVLTPGALDAPHMWPVELVAQVPVNAGLRFSMKARRPSMKSLLVKHCSTISAQRATLRLDSSFKTSPTIYLTAFTVSGALAAIVSAYFFQSSSSSASGTTRLTRPIRRASSVSNWRAVKKISRAKAPPTTSTSRRSPA